VQLFEFRLPDIGEGVAEGEIVEWKVKEGDSVQEDQVLLEVMTDKATVEISNPVRGKIEKIVAAAGSVVPVGAVLVQIRPAEGAHVPTIAAHGEHGAAHEEKKAAAPAPAAAAPAAPAAVPDFVRPAGQRALATPYTRRLAREAGVDIEKIRGTGEAERVTPDDVARYVASRKGAAAPAAAPASAPSLSEQVAAKTEAPAPAAAPVAAPAPLPVAPGARETRIPIRGLRKKISERMHQSKSTAAHFTYVDEVDVTDLVKLRAELKDAVAKRGAKLTYMPFIMKAIVSALKLYPNLNGLTDDARQEFVVKHYYNFGVAVDTDDGLIVPVVKDVDRRSMIELAQEIDRVATDARNGKSKLEDLKDGTFTITNAGNIGGLFATPVINYPEAAIVGVHAIKQKPWIVGGEIRVRDIMYLSISIDHRMNDGATGARFMNHVVALLSDPRRLLLEI
jgi:pyruvate dehydrogenase E2 component (dihydrolipoamide acetyltransferase)